VVGTWVHNNYDKALMIYETPELYEKIRPKPLIADDLVKDGPYKMLKLDGLGGSKMFGNSTHL
jgi:hypothetical protein